MLAALVLIFFAVMHTQVLDRDVEHLSGGELQRFAIAVVAAQQADVYMIDEPSSYLDVRQRLKAAQVRPFLLDSLIQMPLLLMEGRQWKQY
jgi:translation initiation factor RLI1